MNIQNVADEAIKFSNNFYWEFICGRPVHLTPFPQKTARISSKPRDARVQGKTVTGNLQGEFDAADEDLMVMDDLINQFSPARQKFVDDYTNARLIVGTAATHTAGPVPPPPAPPSK